MKKTIAVIITILMLMSVPVYADVIDWVLYTDIKAYINDVEISSFNIHNETAVVVEDLANYGFKVVWDSEARTLSVTRDASKAVAGMKTSSASVPTGGKNGDRAMPVYSTDIKTYLDGNLTESYNVGGLTIVYVNDLAELYSSAYVWDGDARTLSMTLSGSVGKPAPKEKAEETEEARYVIKDGVYTSEWAGISFDINGEWEEDDSIMADDSTDDSVIIYGDDVIIFTFSMKLDDQYASVTEADMAEYVAAAGGFAGEDGSTKLYNAELAGNTWQVIEAEYEDYGMVMTAYFRKIGDRLFYLMAMGMDQEAVSAFFESVKAV